LYHAKGGLDEPEFIKNAVKAYKSKEDTLKDFIDEKCDVGAQYTEQSLDLYKSYKQWPRNADSKRSQSRPLVRK
jgi:phage/plasmid-associated DNA primase